MKAVCPECECVHSPGDAIALNRFDPAIPTRYISFSGLTPPRATRAEAKADQCAYRIKRRVLLRGGDLS